MNLDDGKKWFCLQWKKCIFIPRIILPLRYYETKRSLFLGLDMKLQVHSTLSGQTFFQSQKMKDHRCNHLFFFVKLICILISKNTEVVIKFKNQYQMNHIKVIAFFILDIVSLSAKYLEMLRLQIVVWGILFSSLQHLFHWSSNQMNVLKTWGEWGVHYCIRC